MASSSVANSYTASAPLSSPPASAGDSTPSRIREGLRGSPQWTSQSALPSLEMDNALPEHPLHPESVLTSSPNSRTIGLPSTMSSTATSSLSSQAALSFHTNPVVYDSLRQNEGSDLNPPASSSSSVSCSHAQPFFESLVPNYPSSDHALNNNSSTHPQMSKLAFAPTLDLPAHQGIPTILQPLPSIPIRHPESVVQPSSHATAVPDSFTLGADYPNISQGSEHSPAPSSIDVSNATVSLDVVQPVAVDSKDSTLLLLLNSTWTLAQGSAPFEPNDFLLSPQTKVVEPPAPISTNSSDPGSPFSPVIPPEHWQVRKLTAHSMNGTGLYSPSRYPPPRCHPSTHKSVVEKVTSWMADERREHNVEPPTSKSTSSSDPGGLTPDVIVLPGPVIPLDSRHVRKLTTHSMNGTGLYSPSRYPLPRCHPGTRKSVVEEVTSWIADERREHNLLWLYGPAGAGKTALAQTIAEYADERSMLGAAVFLSRTRNQNDPLRLWTTVSHQLIRHNYQSELFIEGQISNDETILTADPRTQFDRLVVKLLLNITGGLPLMEEGLPEMEEGLSEMEEGLSEMEEGFSEMEEELSELGEELLGLEKNCSRWRKNSLGLEVGLPKMEKDYSGWRKNLLGLEEWLPEIEERLPEMEEELLETEGGGGMYLIIIDGLDECQKEEEQCKIVECICNAVRYVLHLPVLWMICSRPEPHLKRIFQRAGSEGLCWMKELRVDDPEAQNDVERYLQDELWRIAKRHGADLCERGTWPPKDAFDKIVTASSGLFVFAVTVGRFIDQPGSNPRLQLAAVIDFIDGSPTSSSAVNPFAYLDKLYLDILERSRSDILPKTLQLLGICAVCPPLPVLHLAQLLEFDLETIRVALVSVHSIVDVPSGKDATEQPLRYYHASFPDFLTNPDRSGRYSQDPNPHRFRIAEACLRVLGNTKISYAENLAWDPSNFSQANPSNLSVSHAILTFAAIHAWEICMRIDNSKLGSIPDTLARFDYRHLRSVSGVIPVQSFIRFLRWLYPLTKHLRDLSYLVRTTPRSPLDAQFIEGCEGISRPLALEPVFDESKLEESPRYVLIGFEAKSVIVLLVPDGVIVYSMEDIDDL